MTDRSVLARWPENAYTCKQFSSYDRSSHNMTDKRAWFGNFDQGQFIRQEENGGRTEYVMMDAEGPGAIVRFWMTFSGINRGQGTLRIYIDNEEKPVIEGNVRDILSGQVLCGEPLSTSVPDEAPMEERGHNLYLPIPYAKRCKVTIESPDLKITPEGKIESKTIVYYAINYRTYTSPVKVISSRTKELKKNARSDSCLSIRSCRKEHLVLILRLREEKVRSIWRLLWLRVKAVVLRLTALVPFVVFRCGLMPMTVAKHFALRSCPLPLMGN